MTIKADVMEDRVYAKIQRLTLNVPKTKADYDSHGNLTKKALKRVKAAVWPQLTQEDMEAFENAIVRRVTSAILDTYVRLGAAEEYVGDDGELRFKLLRHLTPDEELEIDRAADAAIAE